MAQPDNIVDLLILFAVSVLANLFSAFSGGGAGLIQLPALIFLGLPFAVALATHKVASVALGIGATIRHLREGTLQKSLVLHVLAFGLPGVLIGATIIVGVESRHAEVALGVLTASLGIYSWLNPQLGQQVDERHRDRRGMLIGGGALFLIGVLNGSLTSGTGLFVTLWLVRWFGLDYQRAVAHTLVLVGVFWNGAGAVTLSLLSELKWSWLPVLVAGSLIGGYLGAHLSITRGNRAIKRVYEIVTLAIGLKLIYG